ncbi:MAG: LysR substrate-binding domain-containing protein [Gordonia sp. (in: high G+C Gram-positive bacteria)]
MTDERPETAAASEFRLAYVPGATPGKWARRWAERMPSVPLRLIPCSVGDAAELVESGFADAALTRPPAGLGEPWRLIRLYDETSVVVAPKDHVLTVVDDVTLADLDGESLLISLDDPFGWDGGGLPVVEHRPATTADAIELVAAGIGLLVVPQSLARLHHRRDLDYRPLTDGPSSSVGLSWREPAPELLEEFIGVVRGRTANSSRGRSADAAPSSGQPAPKRTAKEKAAAKRAAREAAGKVPGRSFGKSAGRRRR